METTQMTERICGHPLNGTDAWHDARKTYTRTRTAAHRVPAQRTHQIPPFTRKLPDRIAGWAKAVGELNIPRCVGMAAGLFVDLTMLEDGDDADDWGDMRPPAERNRCTIHMEAAGPDRRMDVGDWRTKYVGIAAGLGRKWGSTMSHMR